eukprot:4896246-Prymnesium_polylepis.1
MKPATGLLVHLDLITGSFERPFQILFLVCPVLTCMWLLVWLGSSRCARLTNRYARVDGQGGHHSVEPEEARCNVDECAMTGDGRPPRPPGPATAYSLSASGAGLSESGAWRR